MHYKKILLCLFIFSVTTNTVIPSSKVAKKITDIAGLTKLLQRHGYTIVSATKEKFDAQKIYPSKIIQKEDLKETSEYSASCKITSLDEESFFVEVGNSSSYKLVDKDLEENSLQEGAELLEESSNSHKQTAYVYSNKRAIEVALLFLNHKNW